MSTFAEAHLREMTPQQLTQYDLFLDENDWDIYYWATQEPSPTSRETAEGAGSGPEGATMNARGKDDPAMSPVAQGTDPGKQTGPELASDEYKGGGPRSGEWAQTVGTFKPAHRPVPARWKNSEILAMLRKHVISRSAGGVHEIEADVSGEGLAQGVKGTGGGGEFSPECIPNIHTHNRLRDGFHATSLSNRPVLKLMYNKSKCMNNARKMIASLQNLLRPLSCRYKDKI